MKTFIASGITLILTVCCVVFLTNKALDTESSMLNEVNKIYENEESPDSIEASLKKITEAWSDAKITVSLTVGHAEIAIIDTALAELDAAAKEGDGTEFLLSLARLRTVLSELIASEKLSFGRIF